MKWLGLVTLVLVAGAGWFVFVGAEGAPARSAQIAEGKTLYAETCAACHGARLEGQPNWRTPGPDGRLPAPPHDASGHTWHHPDEVLFRITKLGTAAVVGNGYESNMPGFGDQLEYAQIEAIFTHIKSTWPEELRAHQAEISETPG
ncbi:c-type cytochrome [Alloyangia pacifica]|uniref:c-type cytochrome n=1 Tax=Alloyangia pacifica TaxID=311180 RepID=UPI00131F242F|nr:cytochrome c [Alloyangia pacifica]